jgi:hypothetical protein
VGSPNGGTFLGPGRLLKLPHVSGKLYRRSPLHQKSNSGGDLYKNFKSLSYEGEHKTVTKLKTLGGTGSSGIKGGFYLDEWIEFSIHPLVLKSKSVERGGVGAAGATSRR